MFSQVRYDNYLVVCPSLYSCAANLVNFSNSNRLIQVSYVRGIQGLISSKYLNITMLRFFYIDLIAFTDLKFLLKLSDLLLDLTI